VSATLVWTMRAILLGPGLVNPTSQWRKLYRPAGSRARTSR
jgi:hypothetical protein